MSTSRFSKLTDLARATDSNQRRELLREVTDLFFERRGERSQAETNLFDDVLKLVAAEIPADASAASSASSCSRRCSI